MEVLALLLIPVLGLAFLWDGSDDDSTQGSSGNDEITDTIYATDSETLSGGADADRLILSETAKNVRIEGFDPAEDALVILDDGNGAPLTQGDVSLQVDSTTGEMEI